MEKMEANRLGWSALSSSFCAVSIVLLLLILSMYGNSEDIPAQKCLIIVSGADPYSHTEHGKASSFYDHMKMTCSDNDIYYLTDPYHPGSDGTATISNVQAAFQWLINNSLPSDETVIYISDHAKKVFDETYFAFDNGNISAFDIDSWLDQVQCSGMTVIVNGEKSGMAEPDLSGPTRDLICSMGSDQQFDPDLLYIDDCVYDHIKDTEISNSNKGIYLLDSEYIHIELCDIENNIGGDSQTTAGIYINGGSYNDVDSCDFTKHYRSVWLTCTDYNEIHDSNILDDDNNNITSGTWGQNSVQIGIYLYYSDNNEITEVDFYWIGYCIGIVASISTDIFGDSGSHSEMKYSEYTELYAINYGTSISSGTITHYGQSPGSCSAYLVGYDQSTTTDFDYKNLYGGWSASGSYYTWNNIGDA